MSQKRMITGPDRIREKRDYEQMVRGRSGRVQGRDPALRPGGGALPGRRPVWVTAAPQAGRGHAFRAPQPPAVNRQRRVIAKLSYVGRGAKYAGKVAANARHLGRRAAVERDEGHERYLAREGPFFTKDSDGISATQIAEACKHDPRQFRLVINPNDGDRITDMKGFVREYMHRVEHAVGARIAWAGVIHKADTVARENNRHAHIIIRGKNLDGRELRFSRDFVTAGFRSVAQEVATERLGPMNDRELARLREQQERNRERAAELRRFDREGRSMADKRTFSRSP